MRSVDSLLLSHFILSHHWCFMVIPLIHPHTHLIKYHFNTSLVVHSRSANPPIHTLRGSARSLILSIRFPSHLYVRKMWCNSFRTKLFLFLPEGNCFVSKSASLGIDVGCSPFIPCRSFSYKVISNTQGFLLQR